MTIKVLSQGKGIENVNVYLNQKYYTSTNKEGICYLPIQKATPILLSHLGYETLQDTLLPSQVYKEFALYPSEKWLQTVQVNSNHHSVLQEKRILKNELEERLQPTLAQSLAYIPGVNVISMGTGISKPVIRGMFNNRVLIIENGLKKEMQQWGSDHGMMVDPQSVNTLSIIKGAAVLQYSADGVGGVIDINTLAYPEKEGVTATLQNTYRSVNHEIATAAELQWRRQQWFGQVNVSGTSFRDYKVPATTFEYNEYILPIFDQHLKNTGGQRYTVKGALGHHSEQFSWVVHGSGYQEKLGIFAGAHGVPREEDLLDDGDRRNIALPSQENSHWQIDAHFHSQLKEDLSWETDAGWQSNLRLEKGLPHHNNIDLSGKDPYLENGLQLHTYSMNSRLVQKMDFWEWKGGIAAGHQYHQRSGYEFLIPDYQQTNAGVYVFTTYTPSTVWNITGGVRYDFTQLTYEAFEMPLRNGQSEIVGYTPRASDYQGRFHNLSWVVSTERQWEQVQASFSAGRIFRTPAINEVGINGIHHGTFRHEWGNKDLNPERGYQLDLGLQWKQRGSELSIAPFFNYFGNYIYLKPSGSFLAPGMEKPLPGAGQVYTYTESSTLHTGFEVNAQQSLTKTYSLVATAEYVYHQNLRTRTPIPFTPPFSTTAEIRYKKEFPVQWMKHLQYRISGRWTASQQRVDRNELITEGYFLIDAHMGGTFMLYHLPIEIQFSINNIFNTNYQNHLSRYRILNLPEAGRNMMLTLKIALNKG
ncbi:TonB-dependent receptor [Algivirga pacifica]|uniref:TonB-dependent receptor n=1 Tax=Algivirga pacifica TaxID=1162670 RepID=UPI0031E63081